MNEEMIWIGEFSSEDRQGINALREQQIYAIENGNPHIYCDLCTDDILLMLQGNDVVIGKLNFYECELKLFSKVKFESIKQIDLIGNKGNETKTGTSFENPHLNNCNSPVRQPKVV